MRLIDADALIEDLDRAGILCSFLKYKIEHFPTFEEQKFENTLRNLIQRMRERMAEQ